MVRMPAYGSAAAEKLIRSANDLGAGAGEPGRSAKDDGAGPGKLARAANGSRAEEAGPGKLSRSANDRGAAAGKRGRSAEDRGAAGAGVLAGASAGVGSARLMDHGSAAEKAGALLSRKPVFSALTGKDAENVPLSGAASGKCSPVAMDGVA